MHGSRIDDHGSDDGPEGGHDGRHAMTQLRTAWRRAVDAAVADPAGGGPDLAGLLALLGPDAAASAWACEGVEAAGPRADELRDEAAVGPIAGARLAELAAGLTHTFDGAFAATRPGEGRPWLALRADGGHFAVATRSRALLADLRRRFRDDAP
jgi:hypothetical protein